MQTVKLSGFKELDSALGQLPKATARNTLVRTLKKAAKPVDAEASANAPQETGTLETSVITGTRLTRRQKSDNKPTKSFAEVHIGTALGRGMFTEFGTFKDAAQMWFTRAWASTKDTALGIIKSDLGTEIEKSAARLAKKAAKR